jgi:hypothetical protein
MAVSLDESTGGISGVFSASRGNRLSMRLVAASGLAGDDDGGKMVCQNIEIMQSDLVQGRIQSRGELVNSDGESLAQFTLRYRLERGSRRLQIDGTLQISENASVAPDANLWKNYFAVRTAVAGEASIFRSLVRDKVHSRSTKKLVTPLGVLIDEAEKQTLVAGHGLPLHQKSGDRFLDTLVGLPCRSSGKSPGDSGTIEFRISYVLDCPDPVAVARSCISPPQTIPIEPVTASGKSGGGATEQAWLIHVSVADVTITEMSTRRRSDGMLAARLQLVQTRPKTSKVRIQFCAFAHAAFVADQLGIDRPLEELPEDVTCDDGTVSLTLGSHEAVDLVVVFDI